MWIYWLVKRLLKCSYFEADLFNFKKRINLFKLISELFQHTTAIIIIHSKPIKPMIPIPISSIHNTGVVQLAAVNIMTIIAIVAAPTIDEPIAIFAVLFQHPISQEIII